MSAPLDRDVDLLSAPPAVLPLLARAAAGSLRGRDGGSALPGRLVLLPDQEQDVARLADYARVCGFALRDRVPPTWLHVLTFPLQVRLMVAGDFPYPALGMVHVANAMRLHRPVLVTERLTLSSRAAHVRPHPQGVTLDLLGEARVGEEVVWTGQNTYLVRGARVPDEAAVATPEPPAAAPLREDIAEDPGPAVAHWRLPADLGRRYAGVSGDVNPIHLHPLTARAFGFPRTIAHGMWTHARVLAALDGRLPPAYGVDVRFGKPLLLPSGADLHTRREGTTWVVAVTSADGDRRHLSGRVEG